MSVHTQLSTMKFMKSTETQVTMSMICTTQYYHDILLKNEKHTQNHVYQASYSQCQQYTFNKRNQIYPNHIRNTSFSKLNNDLKIKKSKVINMKYFEKDEKPKPFLEV